MLLFWPVSGHSLVLVYHAVRQKVRRSSQFWYSSTWRSAGCPPSYPLHPSPCYHKLHLTTLILTWLTTLYRAILFSRAESLSSVACYSERILFFFIAWFLISNEVVYWQCYLVFARLVPRETAAVFVQVVCTPYNHAPLHKVTSFKVT